MISPAETPGLVFTSPAEHRWARLFCASHMTTILPYTKPYLSIAEQIQLLAKRNLQISNTVEAEKLLQRVGYYRLSGYLIPFQQTKHNPQAPLQYERLDTFYPGTTLEDVIKLYEFDKKLRLLMLDAIESLEVGLRVLVALQIGKPGNAGENNAFSYLDPTTLFQNTANKITKTGKTEHEEWVERVKKKLEDSREEFAIHFKKKYQWPLPIWISIELWDFGTLSRFVGFLKELDLSSIANELQLGSQGRRFLKSWITSINYVRNVCAHHSRLWNRVLIDNPSIPKIGQILLLDELAKDSFTRNNKIYNIIAPMWYMLRVLNPKSTWGDSLKKILDEFPTTTRTTFTMMGFPPKWQEYPLWK
jgi:abortive infection bacteriophage resistance protein